MQRLDQTITEFLNFARPRQPHLQPCDLEEVLERSVTFLQPELERHQIALERRFNLNGRQLLADADLLHQAFLNIIINAIQAMPHGGRLVLTTNPGPGGQGAKIVIQDTGEGIAPENAKRIFNPFFTTKDKGSGLGLSIVKSIIEGHHGQITIESQIGQGSKVIITLPETAGN